MLFGGVNIDAFFLEYDNDRSGDFAPLRYVRPGHQQVVLGLITTKTGSWKTRKVKARLQEAAQYVRWRKFASARSAVLLPPKRVTL